MPLPLIPIVLGVASAVAGATGVAAGVAAKETNDEAKEINEKAQRLAKEAEQNIDKARKSCNNALIRLGETKINLLTEHIVPFIDVFNTIHHTELNDTPGLDELKNFKQIKEELGELEKLGEMAYSVGAGLLGGAASGGVVAFATYNGAMLLGTASTGTAIGSLTGAAATNATLAWLGGGSLAAGGWGMAAGTAVLGGLVAGPLLAVGGIYTALKADANKENAKSNLAKAEKFCEETKCIISKCSGIENCANLFTNLLNDLQQIFIPMASAVSNLVKNSGTHYSYYGKNQKKALGIALNTALAIKSVLDVSILGNDGDLTDEAKRLPGKMKSKVIELKGLM